MPGPRRGSAAVDTNLTDREGGAQIALSMMVEALGLLDEDGGPVLVGAHLDLAIHRLREWIDRERG